MSFLVRGGFLSQISTLCVSKTSRKFDHNVVRHYVCFTKRHLLNYPVSLYPITCRDLSDEKKHFIPLEKKSNALKDAFQHKKEQLLDTEHRIRLKSGEIIRDLRHQKEVTEQRLREKKDHLVQDILETKAKVKERFDGVVQKDNMFTIPNLLCVTRIAMSPYLGYTIMHNQYELALGLLFFAGISDVLDGWIARKWKSQSSVMGSFLDPLADKVLIATLFIALTYQNLIPLWLMLMIVGRDAGLVIAAFVIRYMSLPPPRTLSRYFDVTAPHAQLAPTFISKVNTAIQLVLVGSTLASPVFGFVDHPAMHVLVGVTAASTVLSAISYLVSKDTYKFLSKRP